MLVRCSKIKDLATVCNFGMTDHFMRGKSLKYVDIGKMTELAEKAG